MDNSHKLAFATSLDETVAPLLSILHDAGRDRERVALELGTEIVKQLHPFSLVVLAMAAGFIIGRRSLEWPQIRAKTEEGFEGHQISQD
ncbi:MAG TPA: hypothetical protein VLZ74_02255 [Methylocella sp.]|nr:hypothetical protein [Methylocella sp.]